MNLRQTAVCIAVLLLTSERCLPLSMSASFASVTALISSMNPALFGQVVTLTANVLPVTATGSVTFYDGVAVLGIGTLSSGQAAFSTSLLPSGTHSLRAYYGGDSTFLPSSSPATSQTVTPSPEIAFRTALTYSVVNDAVSLAVGDLNGDGKPDLVLASGSGSIVSLLLGVGDGTFRPALNYNVGGSPSSVAVGDFNGDGKPDLVVTVTNGNNSSVNVLLGNGDGTFQAPRVVYNLGSFDMPSGAIVGDFNADGTVDIALANDGASTVTVLLGGGDGTFGPSAGAKVGGMPHFVAVGDFNGDGKADLAVTNSVSSGTVSVLIGNGNGTFQPAVNYTVGSLPFSIVAGDFNADGKIDLAVSNVNGNSVSVLLGVGDGTFRNATSYPVGSEPYQIAAVDFNGDGKLDLATANGRDNTVSVLLGNGDGTFQSAMNYAVANGPYTMVAGDFNGDGKVDLAVANLNGSLSLLLGVSTVPVIAAGGVVTGPNYGPQPAPGVITSLFGVNLSLTTTPAQSVPLPIVLSGVSVTANYIPVPLFYVSPTQINFQLPWELLGQSQVPVVVITNGISSAPQTITLGKVSPGIFSVDSSGAGQGAIQISNTAIFAAPSGSMPGNQARPVNRGESITIYCSGLGDVSPCPATGSPSAVSPLSGTLVTPSVTIGGAPAIVSFAGLTPGFVGLYQVNAQVPNAVPSGGQVQVMMTIGGVSSNTVTIAVQ